LKLLLLEVSGKNISLLKLLAKNLPFRRLKTCAIRANLDASAANCSPETQQPVATIASAFSVTDGKISSL
jgi:hypothetical protein